MRTVPVAETELVVHLHHGTQEWLHLLCITTVATAPGFCTLRALTTWKTFTTSSVLQRSMVVAMAQNIPERLTVSLEGGREEVSHNPTAVGAWLPAVDDDRRVSRLPLDFAHLINHLQDTVEVGTLATGGPVLDLELGHTMRILTLHGTVGGSHTYR